MTTKQHYNMELSRYKKAEEFMNRQDISIDAKMKWVPEMREITKRLSNILQTIGVYTEDEALEGFGFEEE